MNKVLNLINFIAEVTMSSTFAHKQIAEVYRSEIARLCANSGNAYAAERYKQYYLFCRNIAMDLPLPLPIPFCRTDKEGIPKDIKLLVPLLKGSPADRRLGLTIARFYESIYCKPRPNLGPIMDPCSGTPFDEDFRAFVMERVPRIFRNVRLPNKFKIIHRQVTGPNGPAMLTAHYDALALQQQGLDNSLHELSSIIPE
jgi:hypothetical protein